MPEHGPCVGFSCHAGYWWITSFTLVGYGFQESLSVVTLIYLAFIFNMWVCLLFPGNTGSLRLEVVGFSPRQSLGPSLELGAG